MYYNVVVKDKEYHCIEENELIFYFGDDKKKALEFFNYIINISDYHVEFLQFNKDEED